MNARAIIAGISRRMGRKTRKAGGTREVGWNWESSPRLALFSAEIDLRAENHLAIRGRIPGTCRFQTHERIQRHVKN